MLIGCDCSSTAPDGSSPPSCHTGSGCLLRLFVLQVFQYVVTVMVALMVMQHAVERYWSLQNTTSSWQALLFFMFISYPVVTLMLVVLTNNEMAIRRFMYYRLMSMQVGQLVLRKSYYRLYHRNCGLVCMPVGERLYAAYMNPHVVMVQWLVVHV